MVGTRHSVIFAIALIVAHASTALPVYHEEQHYSGHSDHHHPPATSYATISTTHVKVQHPPAAAPPAKYETPYKYEYLTQPQMVYKYISLPSLPAAAKYEGPSTPGYKYLAASPTYKYVQPPAVTTEPEAAEEPTNSLKYAFKYEQNAFDKEQRQLQLHQQQQQQQQQLHAAAAAYEQPTAVQYKYVAVPSYRYVQQVAPAEYEQQVSSAAAAAGSAATSYDYGSDDKQ